MIPDKPLRFLITPSAGSSFVVMLLYLTVIYTAFYESVEINEIEIEKIRLIFRLLYQMVVYFMLRKDSISLMLDITRSGLLM